MRDSKTAFAPVLIKQEPRDLSDPDTSSIFSQNSNSSSNNNGYNSGHPHQDSAVDLRSIPAKRGEGGATMTRGAAGGGTPECPSSRYESSHDFVAEIARRVREESSLRALELTPVTGLGPLPDLKTSALTPLFTGPSSTEGRGKSRGEYACGECSSRFDTARDYRAHCLTHKVLMAESRFRATRAGAGVMGVVGEGEGPEEEEQPGVVFGVAVEGAAFTCEDCDMRFSSRDTYAMHMLIRAKNEACFPRRSLSAANTTTNVSATSTTNNTSDSNADGSNTNLPSPSSTSSLTSGTPHTLPIPALLATNTPPDLKQESLARSDVNSASGGRSDSGRHSLVADPSHQLINSLGVEMGRVADYSAAWWSKFMPWMTAGAGLVGGAGGDGEGSTMPMVCYICGELFSSRDSLAMHVLFHTRDIPASAHDSSSAWRKPVPSLSTLPSSGTLPSVSASSMQLLMGQAAVRQLQQQRGYNQSSNTISGAGFSPCQPQLSPTEAAVASAAAAAVAAVSPPQTSVAGQTLPTETDKPDTPHNGPREEVTEVRPQTERFMVKAADWTSSSDRLTSADDGHSRLALPQRGGSAPITSTTYNAASPPAGTDRKSPFRAIGDVTATAVDKPRPLSADHVVLRHRSLSDMVITADRRQSTDLAPSAPWKTDKSEESAQSNGGWHNGSDTQLQPNSAFSVYRLQRLKKLRLAKGGVYRRPGARGRPPMTIYGTAGRRASGNQAATISQNAPQAPNSSEGVSSSLAASSRRFSSMVQALASQGHEVSACGHCELLFGDRTLYQLHMGLHNVNNPWQCNACGYVCTSRLHFATHTLHY